MFFKKDNIVKDSNRKYGMLVKWKDFIEYFIIEGKKEFSFKFVLVFLFLFLKLFVEFYVVRNIDIGFWNLKSM